MNNKLDKLKAYLQKRIPNAKLTATAIPNCQPIRLWLLGTDYPQWQLSVSQIEDLMDKPPYWSFCWASGQVLAQLILTQPELVKGKTVADFGGGSGVVAIAALKAGASIATMCDTDEYARLASQANAELNAVKVNCCASLEQLEHHDIITVADVFYDRDNLKLLNELQNRCTTLIVADSRLNGQGLESMEIINHAISHTIPDLDESQSFRNVVIYKSEQNK